MHGVIIIGAPHLIGKSSVFCQEQLFKPVDDVVIKELSQESFRFES